MARLQINYWAETLSNHRHLTVLLPDLTEGGGPWPVLYLLHGMSQDDAYWCRMTGIERYVNKLPLIVVMPDGGRGLYCDAVHGEPFETHILKDVIGFVDRFFPTIPERDGRAIGGYSMGGLGAVKLAFAHPDVFCSVVGSAGAYDLERWLTLSDCGEAARRILGDDPVGGPNDVWWLAEQMERELWPAIRIECGTEDYLLPQSRRLHDHLNQLGIPHDYAELPGPHSLVAWDQHLPAGIEFHKRALGL
ncbi:MAG: esterase family protein [Candidatus Brocadiaceae bacterium]|nr:esterase family protein [Candidatus Brocadiaceae bacterium]